MDTNKLFNDAAQQARLQAGGRGRVATDVTHWIEADAPRYTRGQQRAICGQIVDPGTFSSEPSCDECRREQANLENMSF